MSADQRFLVLLTALGLLGGLMAWMTRLLWELATVLATDRAATAENTRAIKQLTQATADNTREINQLKVALAEQNRKRQ